MVCQLEKHKPVFHNITARWVRPPLGWLKCNTDCSSRGNPGPWPSSFYMRNHDGNWVGAKGLQIIDSSNIV